VYIIQELSLPDVPINMTLLDERPSGKVCVSYQKQTVVDAIDEIMATAQRIPNLDIAKVPRILRLSMMNSLHINTIVSFGEYYDPGIHDLCICILCSMYICMYALSL
jgi:hypothetical protein